MCSWLNTSRQGDLLFLDNHCPQDLNKLCKSPCLIVSLFTDSMPMSSKTLAINIDYASPNWMRYSARCFYCADKVAKKIIRPLLESLIVMVTLCFIFHKIINNKLKSCARHG